MTILMAAMLVMANDMQVNLGLGCLLLMASIIIYQVAYLNNNTTFWELFTMHPACMVGKIHLVDSVYPIESLVNFIFTLLLHWFGWYWFGHVERMDGYRMARRVLMAEVSGGRVRGRPRLGWMDGVKVASGNRGMTVEAARQCAKDRKEWRALVHV